MKRVPNVQIAITVTASLDLANRARKRLNPLNSSHMIVLCAESLIEQIKLKWVGKNWK